MRVSSCGLAGRVCVVLCLLSLSLLVPTLAAADDWTVKWANGFRVESADGKFKLKLGGRLQADTTFAHADPEITAAFGPLVDGNEFRRARLYVSGTVYERVEFKAQYDFAGGSTAVKDVYLGFLDTPLGDVRIGHFKEPFSLDEQTSSKYIAFLERSTINVFAPSRNVGVMFHDAPSERWTWAAGAFREADDFGVVRGNGKLNLTARVTGLPVYADGGERLVHLGLSLSRKDLGSDPFRFRERPEAHQAPRFVDTGGFAAASVDLLDLEAAVISGPFWAAAEWTTARADAPALGDPTFGGYYLEAGYFLTGEPRRYDKEEGAFGRQTPRANLGDGGGKGAWEVALRYSTLDLTDGAIAGGELDDLSLALNWYPNPVTRVMLNYVAAERRNVGDADFVLLRFQVDF